MKAAFRTGQAAQMNSPPSVRNVVIVHGAWADGSSWSRVIPQLQANGLHVVALQDPLNSLAEMLPPAGTPSHPRMTLRNGKVREQ